MKKRFDMSGDISDNASNELEIPKDVKVVVVGDGAVGKTCLSNVFVNREFPVEYEATVFENYTTKMTIEGEVQ